MPDANRRAVEDLFLARRVEFAFHRKRLEFDLARTVFASATVDPGSALLLRYLQTIDLSGAERVLDVGCGHGTLGIVLQALDPQRRVTMVDRDALALRFTARNLALNGFDDAVVSGSLGYDGVREGAAFDLVVCNVPGKVGAEVIEELVVGSATVATVGAVVGFVVVNPLADALRALVVEPRFELLLDKGNKTHTVILGRVASDQCPTTSLSESGVSESGVLESGVSESGAFDRGVYDRHSGVFAQKDLTWRARTVAGLDEFDSLAQPTKLLRQALQGVRASSSLIINPGQGHRAVIAAMAGYPPAALVARDLLALRASARCLGDAGFSAPARLIHDITAPDDGWEAPPLTILHADDKVHGPWLTAEVTSYLNRVGALARPDDDADLAPPQLLVLGRSGLLGRLEADLLARRPGHVAYKKSVRGHRAVRFVPKVGAVSRRADQQH